MLNKEEIKKIMATPIYRAKGCNKCGFQGYKGRLGVYEIMQITKEIKNLLLKVLTIWKLKKVQLQMV